jgi:hypothetical protein
MLRLPVEYVFSTDCITMSRLEGSLVDNHSVLPFTVTKPLTIEQISIALDARDVKLAI